jgi:PAS domain S-box-containing protein
MLKVLYVDDEPDLLTICKIYLERLGQIQIDTVITANEALEKITSTSYDAIVSDYQMPNMDGISFLKILRSRNISTPFILFTGKGREEVVIEAINNGADFYIQKGGNPAAQFAELKHKIKIIVEQRRTRAELEESQKQVTNILEFLPDATFGIDLEGKVIFWNKAIEDLFKIPKENILGKGDYIYSIPFYGERRPILIDLVLRDHKEIEQEYLQFSREGDKIIGETYIGRPNHTKGIYLWGTASPLYDIKNNIVGAIESVRDITARKKAEKAHIESEQRYRNIVEDQTEFISRFLPNGKHVFVNEAYCRYFNKKRDELIGHKFIPKIPETDLQLLRKHFASLTPETPVALIEHRTIMDSGEIRWQRWSDRAIFNSDGKIIEYQSVGRDMTDIKKFEAYLQDEKMFSDAIIDTIPGIFFVIDQERKYVRCNKSMEELIGISSDQIPETSAFSTIIKRDMPIIEQAIEKVFSEGYAETVAHVMGKEKKVKTYFFTGKRMFMRGKSFIVGTGIDITEKHRRCPVRNGK